MEGCDGMATLCMNCVFFPEGSFIPGNGLSWKFYPYSSGVYSWIFRPLQHGKCVLGYMSN